MTKKLRDLVAQPMAPAPQAEATQIARRMRAVMRLRELRRAREFSQARIAEMLGREQGDISKLERRTDMYVSTLRSYIEAMGGQMAIVAQFPDGEVQIAQFESVGDDGRPNASPVAVAERRAPAAEPMNEDLRLSHDVQRLFPEVGAPIDLEAHAPSVLLRALNDGSPALRERVLSYYGSERSAALALSRLNRLTNPAYRAYRERLHLPDRDPGVTYMQSLWRP